MTHPGANRSTIGTCNFFRIGTRPKHRQDQGRHILDPAAVSACKNRDSVAIRRVLELQGTGTVMSYICARRPVPGASSVQAKSYSSVLAR